MDKEMERLGKERLKRVRRRRQLATFIISMAEMCIRDRYTPGFTFWSSADIFVRRTMTRRIC